MLESEQVGGISALYRWSERPLPKVTLGQRPAEWGAAPRDTRHGLQQGRGHNPEVGAPLSYSENKQKKRWGKKREERRQAVQDLSGHSKDFGFYSEGAGEGLGRLLRG